MMNYIFSITGISFLLGAAAVAVINRRKEAASRHERWVKYFAYLAIVLIAGASIIVGPGYFMAFAVLIAVGGFYEIAAVGMSHDLSSRFILRALIVYTLLASSFIGFALRVSIMEALSIFFIVILFDGFSQLSGQLFGKRKLAPVISPNKTIEGALGGFILAMFCAGYLFTGSNELSILYLLVSCPAALAGDILASWYKRRAGVKDYSNMIPGHGGLLDRFDSFIAAGAAWFFIHMIA